MNTSENDLPAWAEAFHGEGPGAAPALQLDHPITREWAYGDGSGRGVRVAVLDSGIDAGHPLVGSVTEHVAVTIDRDTASGIRIAGRRLPQGQAPSSTVTLSLRS